MSVLFDLDDTILGTRRDKTEIRKECARELGAREVEEDEYYDAFKEVVQGGKVDTKVLVFEKVLGDRKLAEKFAKMYGKRALESSYVFPDAKEVLQGLEVKKGLVTNGPRLVQREKIERFNLGKYFDFIGISGELGVAKPKKKIFQIALESLDSTPEESIYVGNAPSLDVQGAHNAGLTSVLIVRGEDPSGPDPDYEIQNLKEIYDIIDEVESPG